MKKQDTKAYTNIVPICISIVIVFAVLFVGGYVNGIIHIELEDTIGDPAGAFNGSVQNKAISRMNNTSGNWDSALDIVQVVVIISILAAAIGAIFMFTRFGG